MCFQHLTNLIQRETFTLLVIIQKIFLFTAKSDPQIVARRKNFAYAFKWPLARNLKSPPKKGKFLRQPGVNALVLDATSIMKITSDFDFL